MEIIKDYEKVGLSRNYTSTKENVWGKKKRFTENEHAMRYIYNMIELLPCKKLFELTKRIYV